MHRKHRKPKPVRTRRLPDGSYLHTVDMDEVTVTDMMFSVTPEKTFQISASFQSQSETVMKACAIRALCNRLFVIAVHKHFLYGETGQPPEKPANGLRFPLYNALRTKSKSVRITNA